MLRPRGKSIGYRNRRSIKLPDGAEILNAYHYRESRYWHRPERPGRPHVIIWPDPPTNRRLSRAFPTKKKALAFKRHIDRQLNEPLFGPDDPAWEELVTQYDHIKAASSKSHRSAIFRSLASFWKVCRPRRLSEVTPSMLDHYFAEFTHGRVPDRKSTRSERRKDYKALHAFFQLWVRRGLLPTNPLLTIEEPHLPQTDTDVPTMEQWVELLKVLPDRDLWLEDPQAWHLYLLLAAITGLDQKHILQITLVPRTENPRELTLQLGSPDTDDIGLLRGFRPKSLPTRRTPRPIYKGLPPVLSDRIAQRVAELPAGSTYLLPWRSFQKKQWSRIRLRAHFPFPFKSLRRACGTQAAEQQALEAARDALGHASSETTRVHYLEAQRSAIAVAKRLQLPTLPPLPAYGSPDERKRRLRGKPGRRPAGSG